MKILIALVLLAFAVGCTNRILVKDCTTLGKTAGGEVVYECTEVK